MADMFDAEILFRRVRRWSRSGWGSMSGSSILHQMGGRPGVDPYGWREKRIRAAWTQLIEEGSIEEDGNRPTNKGVAKYEGADAVLLTAL